MSAASENTRILLASRPVGAPVPENFHLETSAIPTLQDDEILLRAVYLSLDPYMRGRMNDAKSFIDPVAILGVMPGSTVCQVADSKHPYFEKGEWVLAYTGWQVYAVSDGEGLLKLGKNPAEPSAALGIMGMPGFTAYMGFLDIGQPKEGDTVVVAAATGAVGAAVGQIAKIKGCRVIGVAGGEEKCRYAVETFGFDMCLDHKAVDFAKQLEEACTQGIDVYFENVGGKVFDAALPLLNTGARVPVCGLISQYNATQLPEGPDRMSTLIGTLLIKRIKMQGFIIFDNYGHRYNEFSTQMKQWLTQGKMKYKEDIVNGLENAPAAFMGLLEGKNFGKLLIKVSDSI